jgi:uncharacterized protein (DUF1499 family)
MIVFKKSYEKRNMEKKFAGLLAVLVLIWGCSITGSDNPVSTTGNLNPCPKSPNCVSSLAHDSRHAMPPLPFMGTKDQSKQRIIKIIQSLDRSKIVKISESYIHAQFKSRLFGFVDDVEFQFDDATRSVNFRSASSSGYYDFGVNRRRMSEISKRYLAK